MCRFLGDDRQTLRCAPIAKPFFAIDLFTRWPKNERGRNSRNGKFLQVLQLHILKRKLFPIAESNDFLQRLTGSKQEQDIASFQSCHRLGDGRHFLDTRAAPGGPHIDKDGFTFQSADVIRLPIQCVQFKIIQCQRFELVRRCTRGCQPDQHDQRNPAHCSRFSLMTTSTLRSRGRTSASCLQNTGCGFPCCR